MFEEEKEGKEEKIMFKQDIYQESIGGVSSLSERESQLTQKRKKKTVSMSRRADKRWRITDMSFISEN